MLAVKKSTYRQAASSPAAAISAGMSLPAGSYVTVPGLGMRVGSWSVIALSYHISPA